MLKNRKAARALRAVCFMLLLALMLSALNYVLSPAQAAFYKEEPQTVDAVFLGTSLTYCSVVPALLWQEYGITSYNLSYPMQSIASSYYFLEEFLKTQTPRVVVLEPEAYTFPDEYGRSPENVAEMRFGANMLRAVQADVKADAAGYLVPFMRYHTGYDGLNEGAFRKAGPDTNRRVEERGYVMLTPEGGGAADAEVSFAPGPVRGGDMPNPKTRGYMDAILALCREKGIQLYLYKAPWLGYPTDCMAVIQDWADGAGVPFRDYNLLAGDLALESRDMLDDGCHMSVWGAHKLTRDLGAVLQAEYDLPDHRTDTGTAFDKESWDAMSLFHSRRMQAITLAGQWDALDYISLLRDVHYTVFLSVGGEGGKAVDSPRQLALETMGIGIPLRYQNEEGYAAVIDGGQLVFEQLGPGAVYQVGCTGTAAWRVQSDYLGGVSSIQVNHDEYSPGREGVNIVVYDKILEQVVDRATLSAAADGDMIR